MPLTDVEIRNAKPKEKPYKMGDALRLFLLLQPSGGRLWRFKYRIEGKEQKLGFGMYPDVRAFFRVTSYSTPFEKCSKAKLAQ